MNKQDRLKRYLMHLLAACLIAESCSAFSQGAEPEHVRVVKDFVAAFNNHDSVGMSKFVTDDIQWMSIDGIAISIETDGKAALVSAMDDYFRACPSCRSRLAEVIASRERISAVEVANWQTKDGPRTQRGFSIYEFSNGLIRRVYYFPVEK